MPSLPNKRLPRTLLIVLVALATMIPVVANAAAGFDDVDASSPFVADIQWLADSGVTKGCNPPANDMFCPANSVTREQMAAFMHRLATSKTVDAGMLNGLADTAYMKHGTIVTTTGGTAWLEHSLPPSTVGRNGVDTTVSGNGRMVMGLTAPNSVGGVEYGLASIELCIVRFSGVAYVTNVSVTRQNGTGGASTMLADETDISASGCYVYNVGGSPDKGIGIIALTAGSASNTIRLGSVTATWTTAAATG